ncbi:hypothetical protein [Ancylobacter sp.]|uniref:hypothetical protein n=1 Tax=Ancylobacter sp. TaxID=1872567 RepID=UPI003D10ABE6
MADPRIEAAAAAVFARLRIDLVRAINCAAGASVSPAVLEVVLIKAAAFTIAVASGAIQAAEGRTAPADVPALDEQMKILDTGLAAVRAELLADLQNAAALAFPEVQGHG